MTVKHFAAFLIALLCMSGAFAEQQAAERAVAALKEMCLAGAQYDLQVDTDGNLSFFKLTPGAKLHATVNARKSSGAAAILDSGIRRLADADIRECMKPQIPKIIAAILAEAPRRAQGSGGNAPSIPKSSPTQTPLSKVKAKRGQTETAAYLPTVQVPDEVLWFVVGKDVLARESETALLKLSARILSAHDLSIYLVPKQSRQIRTDAFSGDALSLYFSRQQKVREILMRAGFPSVRVVFVRTRVEEKTLDAIYDDDGQPLEKGLSVEVSAGSF